MSPVSSRSLQCRGIQRQDTFPRARESRRSPDFLEVGANISCFVGRRGSTTSGDALAPPGRTEMMRRAAQVMCRAAIARPAAAPMDSMHRTVAAPVRATPLLQSACSRPKRRLFRRAFAGCTRGKATPGVQRARRHLGHHLSRFLRAFNAFLAPDSPFPARSCRRGNSKAPSSGRSTATAGTRWTFRCFFFPLAPVTD